VSATDQVQDPVVVGVDEVEDARAAVVWAAREAARRGTWVHVVHAQPYPVVGDGWAGGYAATVIDELDALGRGVLREAARLVHETATVEVKTSLVHENPRQALRRAAEAAALVVTGARRRGRLRAGALAGFQLGSTSLYTASHVACPTVVVRGSSAAPQDESSGRVVVGYDGSAASRSAVEWAARQAVGAGHHLQVVLVWKTPGDRAFGFDRTAYLHARDTAQATSRRTLDDVLSRLRRDHPDLSAHAELLENAYPCDALMTAAGHASLLVIGARGRGSFASALLGSTSHAVLHRATGPVVVVPDDERAREQTARTSHRDEHVDEHVAG